jgi:hypothetical protein
MMESEMDTAHALAGSCIAAAEQDVAGLLQRARDLEAEGCTLGSILKEGAIEYRHVGNGGCQQKAEGDDTEVGPDCVGCAWGRKAILLAAAPLSEYYGRIK